MISFDSLGNNSTKEDKNLTIYHQTYVDIACHDQ